MPGKAYEFVPGLGPVERNQNGTPLGTLAPPQGADYHASMVPPKPVAQPQPLVAQSPAPVQASAPMPKGALAPGELLKMARARVREIDAQLKRMGALKRERDELNRLLRAAKERPSKSEKVTPLRRNAG